MVVEMADEDDLMTDADFEKALDALCEYADSDTKRSIALMMNENQIITWEEAEQIIGESDEPIKCDLPQQTRPTEPDNDTDVGVSTQKLLQNDPAVNKINLNNMKRTPIPQLKRMLSAMRENEYIEHLSLANMGLRDMDIEPLIDVVEGNESLRVLNLETNYLSGEFFARLFQAALKNQTLEEIKAVNQGVNFSTTSERDMIKSIFNNRGLLKVSVNFRLPEGRHKVEQATMRNQEIRRILRRQAAEAARIAEERKEEKPKKAEPKPKSTAPTIIGQIREPKPKEEPKPLRIETPKAEVSQKPKKPLVFNTNPAPLAIAVGAQYRKSPPKEEPKKPENNISPKPNRPSLKADPSKYRNPAIEEPKSEAPRILGDATPQPPNSTEPKRMQRVNSTETQKLIQKPLPENPKSPIPQPNNAESPKYPQNQKLTAPEQLNTATPTAEQPNGTESDSQKPKTVKKKKIIRVRKKKKPEGTSNEATPSPLPPESPIPQLTSTLSPPQSSQQLSVPSAPQSTTTATSESELNGSNVEEKPKKKIIRRKKPKEAEEQSEPPEASQQSEGPTEPTEKPKKKIIRRKKKITTELNGTPQL